MKNAQQSESFWKTFRSQPAAVAHPDRVVHVFDAMINAELATKLLEEERFRDRLSSLLIESYVLVEDTRDHTSPVSRRLAAASSIELTNLVRQFGAVYWACVIVETIESKAIAALKQMIGEEAYAAALAHRDLAGSEPLHPASENFDTAVASAGLRCLAGWCGRQPAGFAQRLHLKLPASTELDGPVAPPFDDLGPRIVERIVT